MSAYTMGTAAKAVGKAKSTISKDVRRGKISAIRNADGSVAIEPAELFRVYPPVREPETGARTVHANDRQPVKTPEGNGFDRGQLLERIAEQAETIRDLRERLDLEAAERRQLSERMTGLLTARAELPPMMGGGSTGARAAIINRPDPEVSSPMRVDVDTSIEKSSPNVSSAAASPLTDFRAPWWRRWFR